MGPGKSSMEKSTGSFEHVIFILKLPVLAFKRTCLCQEM